MHWISYHKHMTEHADRGSSFGKEAQMVDIWLVIPRAGTEGAYFRQGFRKNVPEQLVVEKSREALKITSGMPDMFSGNEVSPVTVTLEAGRATLVFAENGVVTDRKETDFDPGDAYQISVYKTREEDRHKRDEVVVVKAKDGTHMVINPTKKTYITGVAQSELDTDYLSMQEQGWYDHHTSQPVAETTEAVYWGQGGVQKTRIDTGGAPIILGQVIVGGDLRIGVRTTGGSRQDDGDEVRGGRINMTGDFRGAIVNTPRTHLEDVTQILVGGRPVEVSSRVKVDFTKPDTSIHSIESDHAVALVRYTKDGIKDADGNAVVGEGLMVTFIDKQAAKKTTGLLFAVDGKVYELRYEGEEASLRKVHQLMDEDDQKALGVKRIDVIWSGERQAFEFTIKASGLAYASYVNGEFKQS